MASLAGKLDEYGFLPAAARAINENRTPSGRVLAGTVEIGGKTVTNRGHRQGLRMIAAQTVARWLVYIFTDAKITADESFSPLLSGTDDRDVQCHPVDSATSTSAHALVAADGSFGCRCGGNGASPRPFSHVMPRSRETGRPDGEGATKFRSPFG